MALYFIPCSQLHSCSSYKALVQQWCIFSNSPIPCAVLHDPSIITEIHRLIDIKRPLSQMSFIHRIAQMLRSIFLFINQFNISLNLTSSVETAFIHFSHSVDFFISRSNFVRFLRSSFVQFFSSFVHSLSVVHSVYNYRRLNRVAPVESCLARRSEIYRRWWSKWTTESELRRSGTHYTHQHMIFSLDQELYPSSSSRRLTSPPPQSSSLPSSLNLPLSFFFARRSMSRRD